MKKNLVVFIGLLFSLFYGTAALAVACTGVFPAAVQSTLAGTGNVTFTCGSRVLVNASPVNTLPTPTLTNPAGCATNTCPTANCSANGATVSTLSAGTFQASSGAGGSVTLATGSTQTLDNNNNTTTDYDVIQLRPSSTLYFSSNPSGSTVYRINTLALQNNATVNFAAGDYWIGSLTTSGGQTQIVTTTGQTRLFILNDVDITKGLVLNTASTADKFFIYAYGNFSLTSANSQINAIIYSQKNVTLGLTALTGSITAQNVTLSSNSTVSYDATAVNNLNLGGICTGGGGGTSQFGVSAPSTGTNCQNMTITVAAQNNGGQTQTGYTGTITLDTQTGSGTWVSTTGGGSFTNLGSGQATYTYVSGDSGSVSFQLNYPASGSAPVTVKAYQTNNTGIFGLSGQINFVPSGLLVTATAVSNPPASPPAAFSATQTAGTPFTIYLTAYNPSSCGIITSYTGAKTIRFYTSYINPTSGTLNATINGVAIASSVGATATTQSITFTNGVATVTGQYNDVGQLTLNVIDTAVSPAGPTGASGNFVVKPASFAIHIPNNSASQTQTAAACLASSVFKKAGNNFTVNVQPRNALGNVTPNYGNETSPQGIALSSNAIYGPTNARNGSLNNGAIANSTTFSKITSGGTPPSGWSYPYFTGTTFSFDEVGCINLNVAVSGTNYLGAASGTVSGPAVAVVGRFTPDHFDVSGNTPQFKTACSQAGGSFTYLDQPFLYATQPILTVTARSLAGTTTQNYTGSFWKLTSSGFGSVYNKAYYPVNVGDTIPALNLSATIPAPTFLDVGGGNATNASAGTGTFSFSDNGGLSIQRLASTLAPAFTAEIQLNIPTITDSDSVLCTGTGCVSGGFAFGATTSGNGISFSGTSGGKRFYHGRLMVMDASGSELLALALPMQVHYYTTAAGFVLNTLDTGASGTCTAYTGGATNIIVTPSSGLSTTATVSGSPTYYFQQGVLNISLSAPTGTTTGYADVEANISATGANLPWLQYNWPYTGTTGTTFSDNPRGRGTFGIFKGSDRIIYQREITN